MDLDKTMDLFKGAKFGDKFLTRDGKIALYTGISNLWNDSYTCYLEKNSLEHYSSNGICIYPIPKFDIVSRYKEPIDEVKLDELAQEYAEQFYINDKEYQYACKKDFKAGYRKAMEE